MLWIFIVLGELFKSCNSNVIGWKDELVVSNFMLRKC